MELCPFCQNSREMIAPLNEPGDTLTTVICQVCRDKGPHYLLDSAQESVTKARAALEAAIQAFEKSFDLLQKYLEKRAGA